MLAERHQMDPETPLLMKIRNFREAANKSDTVEAKFRQQLKQAGWTEAAEPTPRSLCDKFGRPRDLVLEKYMS